MNQRTTRTAAEAPTAPLLGGSRLDGRHAQHVGEPGGNERSPLDVVADLAVFADRERIALGLNDRVVRRLFAAGLGLQAAVALVDDRRAAQQLREVIDELDTAISDIRDTVFSFTAPERRHPETLRSRVIDAIAEATVQLGRDPKVHFRGPIDSAVPHGTAGDLLEVLRSALSALAIRAATDIVIDLSVGSSIVLQVAAPRVSSISDVHDGQIPLESFRRRAASLGGDIEVTDGTSAGFELRWFVPVSG